MSILTGPCTARHLLVCVASLHRFDTTARKLIPHHQYHYHYHDMAEPPSYEESTSGAGNPSDHKGDSKTHQQWSIREQVGLSRTHHVASIVSQIVEHIRERATQGLSKTTLVFIPSDQGSSACSTHGRGGQRLTQLRYKSKRHNRRLS
jgi:hypothetical protein